MYFYLSSVQSDVNIYKLLRTLHVYIFGYMYIIRNSDRVFFNQNCIEPTKKLLYRKQLQLTRIPVSEYHLYSY